MKLHWKLLAFAGAVCAAGPTNASEYGCKVLLCLANSPGSPTEFAECRPPIERLWADLHHGRPFPTCEEGSPGHAELGVGYYDPCPSGTTALPWGQQATLAAPMPPALPPAAATRPLQLPNGTQVMVPASVAYEAPTANAVFGETYVGVRDDGLSTNSNNSGEGGGYQAPGPKVCVGNPIRIVTGGGGGGEGGGDPWTFGWYDRVLLIDPPTSYNYIDVFVGPLLLRRVRW